VIGASSAEGTEVQTIRSPSTTSLSSFCHSLKIDPAKGNMIPLGRPIKIFDAGKSCQGALRLTVAKRRGIGARQPTWSLRRRLTDRHLLPPAPFG